VFKNDAQTVKYLKENNFRERVDLRAGKDMDFLCSNTYRMNQGN